MVWARAVPLAATPAFDVSFSSSGYLDVSVHRVPPVCLFYSVYGDGVFLRRVSPFRHLRLIAYLQLPAAFRSLSRLSSALSARASVLCPSLLDLHVDRFAIKYKRSNLSYIAICIILINEILFHFVNESRRKHVAPATTSYVLSCA